MRPVAPTPGSLHHMHGSVGLAWGRWVMLCADPRWTTALIPADDTSGRAEKCALKCLSVEFLRGWILERISQLDPTAWRGALVAIHDLRRSPELLGVSSDEFNQTVLELGRQGRVAHAHAAGSVPWTFVPQGQSFRQCRCHGMRGTHHGDDTQTRRVFVPVSVAFAHTRSRV